MICIRCQPGQPVDQSSQQSGLDDEDNTACAMQGLRAQPCPVARTPEAVDNGPEATGAKPVTGSVARRGSRDPGALHKNCTLRE